MRSRPRHLSALALTLLAAAATAGAGCGDDPSSQPAARTKAALASCDHFARCGEIGPGKMYETRGSCDTQQNGQWETYLPPATCDGRVHEESLQVCLDTIRLADCGSLLDLASVLGKCSKERLCVGPSSAAGADAGRR